MHRSRSLLIIAAGLLIAVGCTRPESEPAAGDTTPIDSVATTEPPATASSTTPSTSSLPTTTPPTTVPATDAPAGTEAPPPTTVPASTTPPSTAPPVTSAADLTLLFDGILPLLFGDRDVDVVPVLSGVFGEPTTDAMTEYPTAEDGLFLNDEEEAFVSPFGRRVCWSNSLCVQFGAGAPDSLIFTGWELGDAPGTELRTADGVGIGDLWADHPDTIVVDPLNSCFSVAYASAAGVDVTVSSAGEFFVSVNDDGEFVPGDPDPADVSVIGMSAGELPIFLFADC